jgi:hypothetical protein
MNDSEFQAYVIENLAKIREDVASLKVKLAFFVTAASVLTSAVVSVIVKLL